MKSIVKNLTDSKVEVTITVDAKEIAVAEKIALAKLARDVKMPGFRKGKTPPNVANKNIDPNTLNEQTIGNAINKAIVDAFSDNKLQALDRPAVEVKKFVPGEILEFTAVVDILPTVKLGNYKKLKVTKEKISISDTEVADTIERIRQGFSEKKEVKSAAKEGDETIIDFVGKKDGAAFDGGTGKDHALQLGSNQFIPGFEKGIIGHKAGDEFDLELKFPSDYHVANLKGTKVKFSITLKSVKEVILPEVDDKLAAKAGSFKTISELKTDIKKQLEMQKEKEVSEKIKDDLIKQLVAISKVPVPEILISDQMKSIENDFVNNLQYQGISLDQYLENKGFESKEKWLESEVKDVAIKRVKAGLVLAELSKSEDIKASDDEIKAHIDLYKQQYANNAEVLKQFELPEVQNDIANRLITEKTVVRLVELNTKN